MTEYKKRIMIVLSGILAVCIIAVGYAICVNYVPRDTMDQIVRSEYSVPESENLEFIGTAGTKNKVMVWFVSRNDATKTYYPVSYYALGRKKNIYFLDEAYDPIVGGDSAYQEWSGGTAYVIYPDDSKSEKNVPLVGFEPDNLLNARGKSYA